MLKIDPKVFEAADEAQRDHLVDTHARTWVQMADLIKWCGMLLFSIFPLWGVRWCLEAVAGKETTLDVTVVASVSLVVSGLLGGQVLRQRRKMTYQRNKIATLQNEKRELDRENRKLKDGSILPTQAREVEADSPHQELPPPGGAET